MVFVADVNVNRILNPIFISYGIVDVSGCVTWRGKRQGKRGKRRRKKGDTNRSLVEREMAVVDDRS